MFVVVLFARAETQRRIIVTTGMDGETIDLNIVFDNALVILDLQVVNGVFGITGRIDGAKLSVKGDNEHRPIVHPSWVVVRVDN